MPSEERDAEMLGVPITRTEMGDGNVWSPTLSFDPPRAWRTPGRWHAEPVAVAMVEVVEAGKRLREWPNDDADGGAAMFHEFCLALDNLDAALGGGR